MVDLRWFIRGSLNQRPELRRRALALVRALKANHDDELSIAVCADRRMRTLNRRYRGEDRATDVLAFAVDDVVPLLEPGGPLGVRLRPHPDIVIGEVVINYRQVERQARVNGNAVGDELGAMLVHGVAHLLGFHHKTAREAKRMLTLERRMHKFLSIEVRQFGH